MTETKQIRDDFKLLAIRPNKGCYPKFLKILTAGEIYQFYGDYEFVKKNKEDQYSIVDKIISDLKSPDNLYDIDGLKVSISAIVGKNGSGKSSLIELLYYSQYYLGVQLGLLKPENIQKKVQIEEIQEEIDQANGSIEELKAQSQHLENLVQDQEKRENNSDEQLSAIKKLSHHFQKEIKLLGDANADDSKALELLKQLENQEKKDLESIMQGLKVSVFYQLKGVFYELIIDNDVKFRVVHSPNSPDDKEKLMHQQVTIKPLIAEGASYEYAKELLSHWFYTVSIDHSAYSLNSRHIGSWIQGLFHKNDGYEVPISINPMRTVGKFDINSEREFALNRLLQNLLTSYTKNKKKQTNIPITNKQSVSKFRFTFDSNKDLERQVLISKRRLSGEQNAINLLTDLLGIFFDQSSQLDQLTNGDNLPFLEETYNYIVYKVSKIASTYTSYNDGYDFSHGSGQLKNIEFLKRLFHDDSHITYKLKQAVHFIQRNALGEHNTWQRINTNKNGDRYFDFTPDELLNWMGDSDELLINKLPPSIFTVDLIFSDSTDNNEVTFSSLSSGEQQLIHALQSILYHLNNLESIHHSGDKERIKYDTVNIIYDEIELYFHPEYQRQFISRLLDEVKMLNLGSDEKGIKFINILLSTHSPFILSDIPVQNILCIENGESKKALSKNSFAANIHDLLAHEFFMDDGFMGEFAKGKINGIILFINYHQLTKDLQQLEKDFQENKPETDKEIKKIKEEYELYKSKLEFDIATISKKYPLDELRTENKEHYLHLIDIVGEPIIRAKLRNMYNDVFELDEKEHARKRILDLAREAGIDIKKENWDD